MQESGEMYLETIYRLSKEMPVVRSIDVGEALGYSKPSVSRAIGLLRKWNYVEMEKEGQLILTKSGAELAHKIYERHTFLSNFLISLGVSPSVASMDACKIEHHISDESIEALKSYAEQHTVNNQ